MKHIKDKSLKTKNIGYNSFKKGSSFNYKKRSDWYKLIRTLVYFVFVALLISPIFIMLNTSLKTYNDVTVWPPTWFGGQLQWSNYYDILAGDKSIVRPLINSLIVSIVPAIVCVILGTFAAYGANRYRFKFKNYFLMIIVVTQMFAAVVLANPMSIIFRDMGILNTHLSLIIANTAVSLPMTVWLMYSYISSIPIDLEEAAWIDGCSRVKAVRIILMPLLAPGIITAGLFAFIVSWGDLLFANAFIVDPDMKTIPLALTDFQSLYKTSWELQTAASLVATLPTFFIFILIQKHIVQGIAKTGVKG